MELPFTPEQEAHLVEIARHEGKSTPDLLFELAVQRLEGEYRFRKAVELGLEQANAGELIEEDAMDARFEKMIRGSK